MGLRKKLPLTHRAENLHTHPTHTHAAKSFYPPYTAETPCPSMLLTNTYLSLHCFWIVHASLLVTLVYCRAASMKKNIFAHFTTLRSNPEPHDTRAGTRWRRRG